MEALTLALPLNSFGSLASATADGQLLKPDDNGGEIVFAALLATGLELAQSGLTPQAPLSEPASTQSNDAATTELAPETPTALAAASTGAPPLSITAPPLAPLAQSPARHTSGIASREGIDAGHGLPPVAAAAAPIAAEAAMIAAKPGADTALEVVQVRSESARQVELFSRELQPASTLEPSAQGELASHALLAPVVEQRPSAMQPTALLDVAAPVSGPGFADALSRQVVWMADKDAQVAELRVNPPELGPVEVRLTLSGDTASAQFTSPHAEVRNAIESALERLRETMAQAGIQLGEATVSAESFRDQAAAQSDAREARHGYRDERSTTEQNWASLAPSARTQRGLIDLYA